MKEMGGSALKMLCSFQQEVYNGIKQFRFFFRSLRLSLFFLSFSGGPPSLLLLQLVPPPPMRHKSRGSPPSFATLFPKYNPHIVKLNNATVHQAIFFLLFFLLLAPTCRFFLNCCTRYEHGMSKRALLLLRAPKKRSRLHLKPIEKKKH